MNKNIDMTHGVAWKQILSFSIPIFITGLISLLYDLADTTIVGRFVGVDALASVSCTGVLSSLVFNLTAGMISGLVVITSQRFGAKDEQGVRDSIAVSIVICTTLCIILSVLGCIFAKPLLHLINVPEDIIGDAYKYLMTIYIGATPLVMYSLFASVLRAIGDSKTPLFILILSAVLNVGLNIVFICIFKTGVLGAGIATVIAKLIACVVCAIYAVKKYSLVRLTRENFRIKPRFLLAHIKLGLPMGLQSSIYSIGTMVINSYVNPLGPTILAAMSTAGYVRWVPSQFITSITTATSTFVAQNIGAGNTNRVKYGINTTSFIIIALSILGSVFSLLSSDLFVNLIVGSNEPLLKEYVFEYVAMMCPVILWTSIIYLYRGAIISMGQSFLPFIYGFLELAAQISTAIIFIPKIGFAGAALSQNAALFTTAILSFVTYIVYMRKHYGTAFKTQKEPM